MSEIEHVVVLMFENRSFDHLLGLLSDDPSFPGVRLGDPAFSNPVDPTDPSSARVMVSDDATADLAVDPPHSHAAVIEQLGLRAIGGPAMNGFVAAYARRLTGERRPWPVVHWSRIAAVLGLGMVVVAALLAQPWAGPLLMAAAGLTASVLAVVGALYRRRAALPIRGWRVLFVGPVSAIVALAVLSALLGRAIGYGGRLAALLVASVAAGGAALASRRKRHKRPPPISPDQARQIMRCMRPMEQCPALATLAKSFALCTRWHSSVPGATWPNRNFVHAGTSDGTVDVEVGLYENPTIFQRLGEAGKSWRIYRYPEAIAQAMAFAWLLDPDRIGNWRSVDTFAADVTRGLASYSFIEPAQDGPRTNSQHPGNNDYDHRPPEGGLWDFERGEQLLISVYQALRDAPAVFDKTLLIVTYDEHGGFYDHVPPPTDAVEPEPFGTPRRSLIPRLLGWFAEQPHSRFRFKVLGPRVPAVVISPRVPAQLVDTVYDHTAIPRTVRKLFAPTTAKLSDREDRSPTLEHLASLALARPDLPDLSPLIRQDLDREETAPSPPPPGDDEFIRQLHALKADVHHKLTGGTTPAPPGTGMGPSAEAVAALFTQHAEAGRAAGP